MQTHIALLRGINVGGKNLIPMAELRTLAASLGFQGVQTLLQSGNLVVQSEKLSGHELEAHLEVETSKRFGIKPDYVVRTAEEIAAAIASNPFPKEAETDPSHLVVMFLKSEPEPGRFETLRAAVKGSEILALLGRHLFITYPDGIGNSKLTINVIESKLGVRGTARNWNTVSKLAALASSAGTK